MAILGNCPACGVPMQVPDDSFGGRFCCAKCRVPLTTSEGGEIVTEPIPTPRDGPADRAPGRRDEIVTEPIPVTPVPRPSDREVARRWGKNASAEGPSWRDEEDEDLPPRSWLRRGRSAALAKVRVPATILQAYGVLLVLGAGALPLIGAVAPEPDRAVVLSLCIAGALVCAGVGAFTILAGSRMKALRSYGLALAAVILTFVVAVVFCVPLVVVSIWPFIVLLDAEVKAGFAGPPE